MAKIYSKGNALQTEHEDIYKKLTISGGVCVGCFILWIANILIFHSFSPLFIFPVFIGFALSGICSKLFYDKYQVLKSGIDGEANTARIISSFPDTYSAITNATISYDGKTSELDAILVGPKGIFVIETKNHNGTIYGSFSDDKLTQYKVGQKGTPYSKQFYNPIKQVSTQVS